ncbi:MAG: SDR family NAD(P)-dependent oxidoreductase, partial [Caldicoprobacter sp.]|uniref:SDR family NAD(P)-dependent oxidoreductase n=1 Tax=Caldicoprobacter sp. TaxID=2004500 RepID=UPI0039C2A0F7
MEYKCRRLEGQIAIVTGAGQGLGEAIARRLNAEGAKVVVTDINFEAAQKVAADLNDAIAIKVDVTKYDECEEMARVTVEKYGRIDLLVSNAGILIAKGIDEFTTEEWRKVIDVNLIGYFNSAKAVVPIMIK